MRNAYLIKTLGSIERAHISCEDAVIIIQLKKDAEIKYFTDNTFLVYRKGAKKLYLVKNLILEIIATERPVIKLSSPWKKTKGVGFRCIGKMSITDFYT